MPDRSCEESVVGLTVRVTRQAYVDFSWYLVKELSSAECQQWRKRQTNSSRTVKIRLRVVLD